MSLFVKRRDWLREAEASMEAYYEYDQPANTEDYNPILRLAEAIAESLLAVAVAFNEEQPEDADWKVSS